MTPRTVSVWLPEGYRAGEECCVLYMHDGQMLFDSTTTWNRQEWKVDEVLGGLMADGSVKRTIVVGIDNTPERLRELMALLTFVVRLLSCAAVVVHLKVMSICRS